MSKPEGREGGREGGKTYLRAFEQAEVRQGMGEGEQVPLAAGECEHLTDGVDALTLPGCVASGKGGKEGGREVEGDCMASTGRGGRERGRVAMYKARSAPFPACPIITLPSPFRNITHPPLTPPLSPVHQLPRVLPPTLQDRLHGRIPLGVMVALKSKQ